ncbi:DUF2829 domain-containing protein [Parabacteroides sp. AM08-6]|uniref:DUF2829 domain-containing protein n=1 Tax=Parabacteroides sp. AM08-6 TaxID=2292053 RepID=UPI001F343118|nr:DUF2829 domain-containing protein [Parabacteroides sp. AM08-6]
MKKYIGTKQLLAVAMTLGAYNEYRGWEQPENEDPNADGYLVEYLDGGKPNDERHKGYISWSPKDVFEKAYQVAETHIDRLCIEKKDLADKFEKCSAFVRSDKFREVVKDDIQAFLLVLQRELMGRYNQVLDYRLFEKSFRMEHMSFGMAIEALKYGLAVRRSGWNGKGLFVVKQIPAHITEEIIPKMQSLPQSAKDLILKGKGFVDYTSQCLIYNENTGRADSWVPSISDVFAEDWEVVG